MAVSCNIRSIFFCLVALSLPCICLRALEPPSSDAANGQRDYPESLPPDIAEARFDRAVAQSRRQQREQLRAHASRLQQEIAEHSEQWLKSGAETTDSLDAWNSVAKTLEVASDMPAAFGLIYPLRARLSPPNQKRLVELVEEMSPLMITYRQEKQAYKKYQANRLAKSWNEISLRRRTIQLQHLFALDDQSPEWLQLHRSPMASLPLERNAKDRLRQFESKRADSLARSERQFQTVVDDLVSQLKHMSSQQQWTAAQSAATDALLRLLTARYGRGYRGLMLCEVDPALPAPVAEALQEMLSGYRQALDAWRDQHQLLLKELTASLVAYREQLRSRHAFAELMAVDLAVDQQEQIVKPVRIFASRSRSAGRPEDCWLLDAQQRGFHVEFCRDRQRVWLPRELVRLAPASDTPPYAFETPPSSGPGTPLSDPPDLTGTLVCFMAGTWQSCVAIDESPFGVVVQFSDSLEPVYPIVPYSCLRRTSP